MKKTIQINIGGRHFHMDEDAFHKLNHYLESLKSHFAAEGETGKEIMEDIEQRIAELLEKKLTPGIQAISLEDVNEAIGILGKVEDFVYSGTTAQEGAHDTFERRENRRFYRDEDSNYIGGVAAGMGAYFDIDPLWLRLAFVALIFLHGLGILIYAILWIVVPKARTTAEKLQMRGLPVTLSTIRESVNLEYEKVRSGLNNLGKSPAANRTRNLFENLIRAVGLFLMAIFKFVIGAIGVVFIILGAFFLTFLIMFMMGFTHILGNFHVWNGIAFPHVSHLFASSGHYYLMVICVILLVLIPVVGLIYAGIKIIFNIRTRHRALNVIVLVTWIFALILFICLIAMNAGNFAVEATSKNSDPVENKTYPRIYIEARDNTEGKKITQYMVFDHRFNYSEQDESLYTKPDLSLASSEDQGMYVAVEKHANNIAMKHSQEFLDRIRYHWEQKDSVIYIDRYLNTDDEDFWMFARINLDIQIPGGQVVVISDKVCDMLDDDQRYRYCTDSLLAGKPAIMTDEGLMLLKNQKTKAKQNK